MPKKTKAKVKDLVPKKDVKGGGIEPCYRTRGGQ
jgi:hypothetical protein